MKNNDLVIAKKSFSELHNTEFKQGKIYRCCKMDGGYLVYGEWFNQKQFDNRFAPLIDVIKSEWQYLGLIQPNGKPCTKKTFKELLYCIPWKLRGGKLNILYFYKDPTKLIYSFVPRFVGDTKAQVINDSYEIMCRCIEGEVYEFFDELPAVQRGNSGIPHGFLNQGEVRWRETTNWNPLLEYDGYKMSSEMDDLPF